MNDTISIIPKPVSLTENEGNFLLDSNTTIRFDEKNKENAEFLKKCLAPATGFQVSLQQKSKDTREKNIINLELDSDQKNLGKEGYALKITQDHVVISGLEPVGVFYGIQTLRQLLPVEIESPVLVENGEWSIPCVEIIDYPRFPWRGFMLDVGRHFFGKEIIKKLLDLMALQKQNVFHWHINDDQGWRLEIKKYPKLVDVGSKRKESQIGGFLSKKTDGIPHEGAFTQEDVKEIVSYASERFIKVVPEIEMPGHCMASLAAYPELSCTGGPFEVPTFFGIKKDVYCAGKEKVFEFLQDVLDEVLELFPSDIVHIGGDEVPKKRWKECADCQRRITEENLKDEKELQVYFTNRMIEYLTSNKNRTVMGWNEILEKGLDKRAIGQYWLRGMGKVLNHLRNGGKMVMSHYFHTYLDYNYGFCPLNKAYNYEPIPKKLEEKYHENVLGIEAPMWTEFSPNQSHLEVFVFPRLTAIAETGWTPREKKDYIDFKIRLATFLERLTLLGVKFTDIETCEPWLLKKLYLKATFWKQASKLP